MSDPQTPPENLTLDFSAKDPVCGMIVDPPQARGKARYQGENYFFCSPGCMHKFTADPAKYVAANGEPAGAEGAAIPLARRKPDKDPVCGMTVDPVKAASSVEYEGKVYYFCSRGCAEKFQRDAKKYLDAGYKPAGMPGMVQIGGAPMQIGPARKSEKDAAAPVAAPAATGTTYVCPMDPEVRQEKPGPCPKCGMALEPELPRAPTKTQWTCPMHPEIVRDAPGACPICGMALEPMTVTAAAEDNPELRAMTRRFWTSVLLGIPLVAFAMLRMSSWLHAVAPRGYLSNQCPRRHPERILTYRHKIVICLDIFERRSVFPRP